MKDMISELLQVKEHEEGAICNCVSPDLTEEWHVQRVPFDGSDEDIEVSVPVIHCLECGAKFTDERAEKARHVAICKHQGLLTPEEVKAVRENMGYSRLEFAKAYGIPTASMERWENGRLIQNKSNDLLLRMLGDLNIASRFDQRNLNACQQDSNANIINMFDALAARPKEDIENIFKRQNNFKRKRAGG